MSRRVVSWEDWNAITQSPRGKVERMADIARYNRTPNACVWMVPMSYFAVRPVRVCRLKYNGYISVGIHALVCGGVLESTKGMFSELRLTHEDGWKAFLDDVCDGIARKTLKVHWDLTEATTLALIHDLIFDTREGYIMHHGTGESLELLLPWLQCSAMRASWDGREGWMTLDCALAWWLKKCTVDVAMFPETKYRENAVSEQYSWAAYHGVKPVIPKMGYMETPNRDRYSPMGRIYEVGDGNVQNFQYPEYNPPERELRDIVDEYTRTHSSVAAWLEGGFGRVRGKYTYQGDIRGVLRYEGMLDMLWWTRNSIEGVAVGNDAGVVVEYMRPSGEMGDTSVSTTGAAYARDILERFAAWAVDHCEMAREKLVSRPLFTKVYDWRAKYTWESFWGDGVEPEVRRSIFREMRVLLMIRARGEGVLARVPRDVMRMIGMWMVLAHVCSVSPAKGYLRYSAMVGVV